MIPSLPSLVLALSRYFPFPFHSFLREYTRERSGLESKEA